jgi:hypothetical protein
MQIEHPLDIPVAGTTIRELEIGSSVDIQAENAQPVKFQKRPNALIAPVDSLDRLTDICAAHIATFPELHHGLLRWP